VKIGYVKSGLNGEISPNLVTLMADRFLAKKHIFKFKSFKKLDAQNLLFFGSKSADEIDRNGLYYKTFKA
jgi:hypothetical protein